MTKVIMGIGIPGSGKTTFLKQFAHANEHLYICPDDIRYELTGNSVDQSKNKEVWRLAYERVQNELSAGVTVVFDATFANQRERKECINFCKEHGADKVQGIFF